jgi:hypothetical protein
VNPITIAINPEKADIAKGLLRAIDREDLVKILIAFGLEPARVEGDTSKVVVFFTGSEVEKFDEQFLSNKSSMVVPVQRVIYANEYWRNLLTLWKSKMQQSYASE